MPRRRLSEAVEHFRTALLRQDTGSRADAELLNRFVRERDEVAFETLVRRHGPMVLGVCRRVLRNDHDAEDAFQATFLVLVRRARSIRPPGLVGHWLYGVACRTALEARRASARRRMKEANAPGRVEVKSAPGQDEWREVLDEELARLPEHYRVVVVLSDLQGKGRREVAEELGCPEGTVASRLARARNLLADRLRRRGHTLSAGTLAALPKMAEPAVVPGSLSAGLLNSLGMGTGEAASAGLVSARAAALSERVARAMSLVKLQVVVAVLMIVGLVGTGAGWLYHQTAAVRPDAEGPARPEKDSPGPAFSRAEVERLFPGDAKASTTVTDPATLTRLAAFFPGLGEGKKSAIAAGWKGKYKLIFVPAKGKPLTVFVDHTCETWSEGLGDHDTRPGLEAFLDNLLKKHTAMLTDTGWSPAVNGLQGRLVRHPRRMSNGTEIIVVGLELRNLSTGPLGIADGPSSVRVQLFGADGKAVSPAGLPRSGPVPFWQAGVLPRDCYLGFPLYDYGIGIPKDRGGLLAVLESGDWILDSGKYTLQGTFTIAKTRILPEGAWVGRLDLPPLEIEIP